jgi:hypothetical protein
MTALWPGTNRSLELESSKSHSGFLERGPCVSARGHGGRSIRDSPGTSVYQDFDRLPLLTGGRGLRLGRFVTSREKAKEQSAANNSSSDVKQAAL